MPSSMTSAGRSLVLTLTPPERCFDLAADDRVCVSIDTYPNVAGIEGVVVHGRGTWTGPATLTVDRDGVVSFDFSKATR